MPSRTLPTTSTAEVVPELIPPAVPDDIIDEVYREIRTMQRDSLVDTAIRVGRLIVDRFYGGELAAWHDRGTKDASFRKLARRFERDGDAGQSAAGLYRAVAIYELDLRLGVADRKHLTVTHLRVVLGLPEERQRKLLEQADRDEWTSGRLERQARKVRKAVGDGRGRPPLPAFLKTWHRLRTLLADDDAFDDLEPEALAKLEDAEAETLAEAIAAMRTKCDELQRALSKRKPAAR